MKVPMIRAEPRCGLDARLHPKAKYAEFSSCRAGMVKWHTRQTQNLLPAMA